MFKCRVCGNTVGNRRFTAREMMFGAGEEFVYVDCSSCGCIQIEEIPADLSKYYPEDYYSFQQPRGAGFYGRFKRRSYGRYVHEGKGLIGRLVASRSPTDELHHWVKRAGVGLRDAILDVGSGGGELPAALSDAGFTNVLGVDPFIKHDLSYAGRPLVLRRTLDEVDGEYDFVMLNHSFEHAPDPEASLRQVFRLLRPRRFALLRVPVAGCFAWRRYGADWVQLDAPRHLFIYSPSSIAILARRASFEVFGAVYDSTGFQFWGSEQYRSDIPLTDPRSHLVSPHNSIFSEGDLRAFAAGAVLLNRRGDGDQAGFYLFKT